MRNNFFSVFFSRFSLTFLLAGFLAAFSMANFAARCSFSNVNDARFCNVLNGRDNSLANRNTRFDLRNSPRGYFEFNRGGNSNATNNC